ncbi:MAG: ASCH domain-containing protein [Planctomycetota bacterium]
MAVHVAILRREYAAMVLSGRKTVESRLMKVRCPPFGVVNVGDRLYVKVSGGPFVARATAASVHDYADQTPEQVDALRERWNPAVCGPRAYWDERRDRPFATMVRLMGVEPTDVGPRFAPRHMRAWYVLDDTADPVMDVPLTRGAVRNRYVSVPTASAAMRGAALTLELPDGAEVETGFVDGGPMLRWRGWGAYFEANGLRAGDLVRLVALGGRRYRVRFRRKG